jgi:hypothetical protein
LHAAKVDHATGFCRYGQRFQSPEFVDPVLFCAAMARVISLPAGILTLFFWVETKTPEFWLAMLL